MNKSKFTPGPWEITLMSPSHKEAARPVCVRAKSAPMNHTITCTGLNNNPEVLANARLIAKAPEIYEIIKVIGEVCVITSESDIVTGPAIHHAIKALLAEIDGD